MAQNTDYTEDNIRSLDWKEHIRMRPGMYIGKLGDGSSSRWAWKWEYVGANQYK